MATFFSGQNIWYWGSPSYVVTGTLTGNVVRSGNTVTLSGMSLALSWPPLSSGSYTVTFTINGTATTRLLTANSSTFAVNNTSFTVGTTDTSRVVSWSTNDGYSGSFTVTFPSGSTAPSGLSVTYNSCTWNSVSITSSLTSWGSGTVRRNIEQIVVQSSATAANWESTGRLVKQNIVQANVFSSTQSVSNSNYTLSLDGGINIRGCTSFKVAAYASTGNDGASDYIGVGVFSNTVHYTPPAPLQSITASSSTTTTAGTALVSATIIGGNSTNNNSVTVTTQYRYRINNGAWSNWTSAGSGLPWSAQSISFSAAYNSSVTIQARQLYQSQYSEVKEYSFTVVRAPLYGSVAGRARKINKLYVSVNGQARAVTKLYGSVNGRAVRIF